MICPMVPFPVTLIDPQRRFQGHGDALDELCAQLTRDLFAIAKFLLRLVYGLKFGNTKRFFVYKIHTLILYFVCT